MAGHSKGAHIDLDQTTESRPQYWRGLLKSLFAFCLDIKISHSIFALPFAVSALFLLPAHELSSVLAAKLFVCMVAARTFAMGINRIFDRKIDQQNPRTQSRQIPKGTLRTKDASIWTFASAVVFIFGAFAINPLTGICSFPVLIILGLYPYWKRWSWLTHWYLGICLGLSPMAVSVAVTGVIEPLTALLGLAVAAWTAGFDIIYALLDHEFDVGSSLHSVPVRFGIKRSLWISRGCFVVAIAIFMSIGIKSSFGPAYFTGVSLIALTLFLEHYWVRESASGIVPRNINAAFFNLNASVSIVYLTFLVIDRTW